MSANKNVNKSVNNMIVKLFFKDNDLIVSGLPSSYYKVFNLNFKGKYDNMINGIRCKPMDFMRIKSLLTKLQQSQKISSYYIKFDYKQIWNDIFIELNGDKTDSKNNYVKLKYNLRSYQSNSLSSWIKNQYSGIIILPTGAGKSIVGISAILKLRCKTLIVVPTIELMDQWAEKIREQILLNGKQLSEKFIEKFIGKFGGGNKEILPITITTYNSGFLYIKEFRDKFGLIIFDEVHHLPGEKFRRIAEGSIAPYRLGLTATLNPDEEIFPIITQLIGKIVYKIKPEELTERGNLADYKLTTIRVSLGNNIAAEYRKLKNIYSLYLKRFSHSRNAFQQMIFRANTDPDARIALEAYNKCKLLSFNADAKIPEIEKIFNKHHNERIIIFCENISFVEKISRKFYIPALTSRISSKERKMIMERFRDGRFRIIVTGKVLDEGVDVPEASVGIIVSGTGTPRQYIQRLGRILRPMDNKIAHLYEIISHQTTETRIARNRKR